MDYLICISGERANQSFKQLIKDTLEQYKHAMKYGNTYTQTIKVLVGDCDGVDASTIEACQELDISYEVFIAEWDIYGLSAGPIRNKLMLDRKPKVVLTFHSDLDKSRGTKNMIKQAEKLKIPVYKYN